MSTTHKINEHIKALTKRAVRASGHSGIICIPACCIGQTYERYMDKETGVITLVPCEKNRTFPGDVDEGGGTA